ncbi:DUF3604 domain-containing protein [Halosolutus halophilus]|uniref:DUF3604 domain-containing protein n=1 Tax=Halosolutus halophilus TaxID=1552990 RepID=UPI00223500EB|nr:DUF3604 domain-containing protein [Halosolutus halophilus]
MVDQRTDERCEAYGTASLEPDGEVVAGSYCTWTVTYTVGELGMDDGSTLKFAANMSSDWGRPQFDDPSADNYATVETSGDASVDARWDTDGYVRPLKDTITIDVYDGALAPGDAITLTLGETGGGCLGHQAQSFPEEDFELVVLVDAFESGEPVPLPEPLTFDVVSGSANQLRAFAPSNAESGDEVTVRVRAEDYWGNTAARYEGRLRVEGEALDSPVTVTASEGLAIADVVLAEEGVHRLRVADADRSDLETTTNPVRCGHDDARPTYWGDIHGQSGETVGTGTIQRYFRYLRENAHLDFGSHAANDFQITDEFWNTIQEQVREHHDPGTFVTFLCYEWSPNTSVGGDHNVYFKGDEAEIHRSSSWQIADGYEKHEGTYPVSELYAVYEDRDDVLIIPHQGGRPAVLDDLDPELTPFVEITSVWGIFEWFGQEALERGYEVGFVGGSDDHTGRPGASYPTNTADWSFPIKGPVMAAKAEDLTRDALWESFTERRVYGTTGARIFLDVRVDGTPMGGETKVEEDPAVDVTVNGTAPLRQVDLFRGPDPIESRSFADDDDLIEIMWTGARSKNRHKVQDWSGALNLSAGRIVSAEPVGFDHPNQGIERATDTTIEWDGATAGNYQGLRLRLDAPEDAKLRIATEPVTTTIPVDSLDDELTFADGPVGRQLSVRRAGTSSTFDIDRTFRDEGATAGRHAYYVRIRQDDGEMAWSSPVFVDVE